jgi:hypothetical protein
MSDERDTATCERCGEMTTRFGGNLWYHQNGLLMCSPVSTTS